MLQPLRYIAAVAAMATLSYSALNAAESVATPLQPVSIFNAGNKVHILTNRVDVDYDGLKDEGDVAAHWVIADPTSLAVLSTYEFPWADVRAERPAFAQLAGKMFITVGDSVWAYDMSTQQPVEPVYNHAAVAVSCNDDGTQRLYSVRTDFTSPGKLVLDVSGAPTMYEFQAGVNVQMSVASGTFQSLKLLCINEGSFGATDGTVKMWSVQGQTVTDTTLNVGGVPNHIYLNGDLAYITCNTSHWVVVIDINTKQTIDTIAIGTTEFDGPRESLVYNGRLYVSTWSGDVRVFDLATGQSAGKIKNNARNEGMAIVGTKLWVARKFNAGTYTSNENVDVFDPVTATSVREFTSSQPKLNVRRITDALEVSTIDEHQVITIANLDGGMTMYKSVAGTTTIPTTGFAKGVYAIRHAGHNSLILID